MEFSTCGERLNSKLTRWQNVQRSRECSSFNNLSCQQDFHLENLSRKAGKNLNPKRNYQTRRKEIIKKYRNSGALHIGIETVDADDYMKI